MHKDLGTHMNGVILGDESAALAICGQTRTGQIEASGYQPLVNSREGSKRRSEFPESG